MLSNDVIVVEYNEFDGFLFVFNILLYFEGKLVANDLHPQIPIIKLRYNIQVP